MSSKFDFEKLIPRKTCHLFDERFFDVIFTEAAEAAFKNCRKYSLPFKTSQNIDQHIVLVCYKDSNDKAINLHS